jgi:serine/threonine protein kinase
VTLYDFAGQPEYHPTHELFLAPDVLFVVVINLRTALTGDLSSIHAEAKRVEEWMRLIASRAPGARVLVVGTHADSSTVDCVAIQSGFSSEIMAQSTPDIGSVKASSVAASAQSPSERLGCVLARVLLSTARQTGLRVHLDSIFMVDALYDKVGDFGAFEAAFRDKSTEIVGERDTVPASIFEMAQTVAQLARKSPVLSLADFKRHIEEVHNWYTPIVPLLLRSAGIIEHFAGVPGLEDDMFLSPEWLAKMLAAIVDERRGHGACVDGIVDAATLHRLWIRSKEVQNEDMRAALIRVMRAFGLLHPVDATGDRFVMPSLLSEFTLVSSRLEVSTLLSRLGAAPRVVRRVYSFEVFPSGLLPRVFSRLHGVRDGRVLGWLTGLLFEVPLSGSGSGSGSVAVVSSATGLLRADVSDNVGLAVSTTHDELFSIFEKALLVVRDVMFAGLQVFRDGTSISVFAADVNTLEHSEGDTSTVVGGDEESAPSPSRSAWGSSGDNGAERPLIIHLGVPVWDPQQFEVRAASPPVAEINVARDLEPRGIQLGNGGFSTVEQRVASATSRVLSPGSSYALKLPNQIGSAAHRASFWQEYLAMRRFAMRCQHLAALAGVELTSGDDDQTVTAILMPLYDSSLDKIVADRVRSCDRQNDEWFDVNDNIIKWFRQVCLGVQTLHDAGVAHLDIKTDNVFARLAGVTRFVSCLAVGDFGTAFEVFEGVLSEHAGSSAALRGDAKYLTGPVGTPLYMAPELVTASTLQPCDAFAADIYSLGVLVSVLITGRDFKQLGCPPPPTGGREVRGHPQSSDEGSGDSGDPWGRLRSVIDRCLCTTPGKRPVISDVLALLDGVLGPSLAFSGIESASTGSQPPSARTGAQTLSMIPRAEHEATVRNLREAKVTIQELERQLKEQKTMVQEQTRVNRELQAENRILRGDGVPDTPSSARSRQPQPQPTVVHDDLREWLSAHDLLLLVNVCPSLRTFRLQTLLRRTDADLRRILGDEGFDSEDGQRLVAAIHAGTEDSSTSS